MSISLKEMNIINSDIIEILRQRIPVGISYALEVLEKVKWDIEKAEHLIKEEYITILMKKIGVSREKALELLLSSCLQRIKNSGKGNPSQRRPSHFSKRH